MKPIKALVGLLFATTLTTFAYGIPNNPFNQFVDEFEQNAERIYFSDKLCAQPVWQELAQAATKANVAEGEDFVNALHDFYCLEKIPDEILLKRLKGSTYVNDSGKTSRSRTIAQLRKKFSNGVGMERPSAVWIEVKNGGAIVDVGIDRTGGGDDLKMRLLDKRWMFIHIRHGGAC